MNKAKGLVRILVRVIVGIGLVSLVFILVGGIVECPATLVQLILVLAVAIWLLTNFFKQLIPKAIFLGFNKNRKSLWKKFWKYIF